VGKKKEKGTAPPLRENRKAKGVRSPPQKPGKEAGSKWNRTNFVLKSGARERGKTSNLNTRGHERGRGGNRNGTQNHLTQRKDWVEPLEECYIVWKIHKVGVGAGRAGRVSINWANNKERVTAVLRTNLPGIRERKHPPSGGACKPADRIGRRAEVYLSMTGAAKDIFRARRPGPERDQNGAGEHGGLTKGR